MNRKLIHSSNDAVLRVCIEGREGTRVFGFISAPYLTREYEFHELGEMLMLVEAYLDELGTPQAFQRARSFTPRRREVEVTDERNAAALEREGALATCTLRVMTRQNSTWQGYADFGNGEKAPFFSSALELMLIIDEYLSRE